MVALLSGPNGEQLILTRFATGRSSSPRQVAGPSQHGTRPRTSSGAFSCGIKSESDESDEVLQEDDDDEEVSPSQPPRPPIRSRPTPRRVTLVPDNRSIPYCQMIVVEPAFDPEMSEDDGDDEVSVHHPRATSLSLSRTGLPLTRHSHFFCPDRDVRLTIAQQLYRGWL